MAIRIAKLKHRESTDVYHVKMIKDENGKVLHEEEEVKEIWKMYFEQLMNVENERIEWEVEPSRESEIGEVSVEEVRRALQKMKRGKAVGPDDIPEEAWKCLGAIGTDVLTDMFNKIIETEKMPDEWRKSTLVPIFKNKGDI